MMTAPKRIFVLIFNARTDNEGIHSIWVPDPQSGIPGAGNNKILMFESEDDATRYALLLEAQDFNSPTVEAMEVEEIKHFCQSAGYLWEIVPETGNLVIPPEVNLEKTDWQPEDTNSEIPQLDNFDLEGLRRKFEGLL